MMSRFQKVVVDEPKRDAPELHATGDALRHLRAPAVLEHGSLGGHHRGDLRGNVHVLAVPELLAAGECYEGTDGRLRASVEERLGD